jgi:methylenetetrahydrofolate dehydrogenase (NADP+) / methenyltetrahydrofolate cyclohydrolase
MKLLLGGKIANGILAKVKRQIQKNKLEPSLAVILIGENKASELYIKLKKKSAEKTGIEIRVFRFRAGEKEEKILELIEKLNKNEKISAVLVQLPLPKKFNIARIIQSVSPSKDADGFHPKNVKKFLAGKEAIGPVFPKAILKLLESAEINLKNKEVAVVANSEIFGRVMEAALEKKKIKARILSKLNLQKLKIADVVITAIGKPKLIKGKMVKKGAIIIDGGITRQNRKVYGDVDFNSVSGKASYLSPVPGGVGPVTVACLMENVCKLALAQKKKKW